MNETKITRAPTCILHSEAAVLLLSLRSYPWIINLEGTRGENFFVVKSKLVNFLHLEFALETILNKPTSYLYLLQLGLVQLQSLNLPSLADSALVVRAEVK